VNWSPRIDAGGGTITFKPRNTLLSVEQFDPVEPSHGIDMVDTLFFDPRNMNNNITTITTEKELTAVTMGQDQRHRTIGRSEPILTKKFYCAPLVAMAGLEKTMLKHSEQFHEMPVSPSLKMFVIPYGAMMRYKSKANLNALIHEQAKRLCWCAQEEIYHMSTQLHEQLNLTGHEDIAKLLQPHCLETGKCCEGSRYCGRELKTPVLQYFRNRVI
jgi:hypothetical protein